MHETALLYEIVNIDAPPISEDKPHIDPELERLILEYLEKDPMDRCQSAAELARNLRRLKRVSTGSRTASRIQQAVPIGNERKKEIKKWKSISIATTVLCVAAIVYIFFIQSPAKPGINLSSYQYTPFETDGIVGYGRWSPDGKWIALKQRKRILLISPDGKNTKIVIPPVNPQAWQYCMAWSRDSKKIYIGSSVEKTARLDVIDVETGKSRKIADYGSYVNFGQHQSQISTASISRDGKGLIVTARFANGSLYILDGALGK